MDISSYVLLLLFLCGGFLTAFTCNLVLLRFSESLGIRNKNDVTIRWSNQSKPSLGGISFYVVFVFFTFVFAITQDASLLFGRPEFAGLLAAGTVAFVVGLADDAYNTKPFLKLSGQILCGVLLILTDNVIHLTGQVQIDQLFTIFWVVLLMNSLNMLDNMDGITGTVALFITITCLGTFWIATGVNGGAFSCLMVAMIGGLIGFLTYNIHPSKLFMGDAGSQFIGLFIAYISIDNLWMVDHSTAQPTLTGIIFVVVCFAAPFSDTLTVIINRLRKGQSPMVGGKDHTTHHLVYAGLNDRQVWYVFLMISILSAIGTCTMSYLLSSDNAYLIAAFPIFSLVIFLLLYRNTIKHKQPN